MSEFIDKAKGAANEAIGKAKVAIGEQTNNNDLIVKGGAQQAKGHAQILGRCTQHVLGAPNCVVDLDALIPHRIPEGVRDLLDVAAPVVDHHEVEVAVWAELPSSGATNCHQGDLLGIAA